MTFETLRLAKLMVSLEMQARRALGRGEVAQATALWRERERVMYERMELLREGMEVKVEPHAVA